MNQKDWCTHSLKGYRLVYGLEGATWVNCLL